MKDKRLCDDAGLAALAKKLRLAAGKKRAEAARELGVARPTVVQAEENPKLSLSKVRVRIIERYSNFRVVGPVYLLEEKQP